MQRRSTPRVWSPRRPRPALLRPVARWLTPALLFGAVAAAVALSGPRVQPTVAAGTPYLVFGRGQGLDGALGQAEHGWRGERILDDAYPGTELGSSVPAAAVRVRLTALDGHGLDVTAPAGALVAGRPVSPGQAVHLTATPAGALISITAGCRGPVLWRGVTPNPWIDPVRPGPNRPTAELLRLCGGNQTYRGALGVALDGAAARVVNSVDVEDYLRGVLPLAMDPDWADFGGAEALRAQAIAARSFALAEHRYRYAQTCDTKDCQAYGGANREDPRTDAAVAASAGTVLRRDGRVFGAEYLANAAPGWRRAFTAADLSRAFGVGALRSVHVASGAGDQVADVRVVGADRTVDLSGDEVRAKLNLPTGGFDIVPGAGGPVTGPPAGPVNPLVPAPSAPGATPDPIDVKYLALGGASGTLGEAVGDELLLPGRVGTFRIYANGVIVWTPELGAQALDLGTWLTKDPKPQAPPAPHNATAAAPIPPPVAGAITAPGPGG